MRGWLRSRSRKLWAKWPSAKFWKKAKIDFFGQPIGTTGDIFLLIEKFVISPKKFFNNFVKKIENLFSIFVIIIMPPPQTKNLPTNFVHCAPPPSQNPGCGPGLLSGSKNKNMYECNFYAYLIIQI